MNLDPGRRVYCHLWSLEVGAVETQSEILHLSDGDACDRLRGHAGDALERENRSGAAFGVGHIRSLMLDSLGAVEMESEIF